MRKLLLAETEFVRRSIETAVKGSRDQLVLHKLHCLLLLGLGCGCHQVAEWFGHSTRTMERWVSAFNAHGIVGLCPPHPPTGRTPKLPGDTVQRLAFELRQQPCVCGYAELHWSGRLVMHHLNTHYGVKIGLRQCQRTLRRLGMAGPTRQRN